MQCMRELIYLSTRKLRQFQQDKPPGRWQRVQQVGATAPMNLGGMQVALSDQSAADYPDLAGVLRHIDRNRNPRWFTEEGVESGGWIRFTAKLNYGLFGENPSASYRPRELGDSPIPIEPALLFWRPWHVVTPEDPHLLLHGSPEHFTGGALSPQSLPDMAATVNLGYQGRWFPPSDGVFLWRLLQGLIPLEEGRGYFRSPSDLSRALTRLLASVRTQHPPELAGQMSGYARVTCVTSSESDQGKRFVVASPLYVEYAS